MSQPRAPLSPPSRHDAAGDADARLVAAALRAGRPTADAAFDRLLPAALRDVSDDYWTPTPVARRVAAWLKAERVRTLVDIGSGCGKLGVTAALLAPCRVIGLEQRQSLVAAARVLATRLGVADRVTFEHGAFGVAPTPVGDAYYLFNPFGEYTFDGAGDADDAVAHTRTAYQRDLAALTQFLAAAPIGTLVITYNGIGRPLPRSYEQTRVDVSFRGALRLWTQRAPRPRQRRVTSM